MIKNNSVNKLFPAITFAVAVGLIITALIWIAKPGAEKESDQELVTATSLVANEQSFDFGEISMADGVTTHDFQVVNTSAEPITINGISTSCMCTEALLHYHEDSHGPFGMPGHGAMPHLEQTINPDESFVVEAKYDPNAHGPAGVGPVNRVVSVETSNGELLELQILAVVTP